MSWQLILGSLSVLFTLYYLVFLLKARTGISRIKPCQENYIRPKVSIVIAARNESATIQDCLRSVLQQDYPSEFWEVVVVDNGSSDGTAAIAAAFEDGQNVHVSRTESQGKPAALAHGILLTKGELVMTTDADCVVPPSWISSMVKCFDDETAFVAGPVREVPANTLVSQLSSLEFKGLIAVAAGLVGNHSPIICNGANVAFRRTAYMEAGGFGDSGSFCDDEVLMQRINRRRPESIRYCFNSSAIVSTNAPHFLGQFWNQRIRWASKRGNYEDSSIILRLVLLYFSFFFFSLIGVAASFDLRLLLLFCLTLTAKILVDYFTLHSVDSLFKERIPLASFLIAEVCHVPYIVLAALIGQVGLVEWKGSSIRK